MSFVKVVLPPNEQHQFTTLCGHVDNKKYDKAIKTADGILKKFPNHGETMALKGLAEHQSGNKEIGYNLARKGLKLDLTSSTAYHVLGVIYRNDRAYHQASKYFQTAMYHDPKNDRILRDLAGVQLHLRQYEEHLKSRKALWNARPDLRTNWVGYALAAQLVGDHEFAANLATLMQESNLSDTDMPHNKWETQNLHSELLLYRNFVLRDAGHYEQALKDLTKSQPLILDKILVKETFAELYIRLGKLEEAKKAYMELIGINPDNIQHHYGLLQAYGVAIPIENIFSRGLDSTGKKASQIVGHFGDKLSAELRTTLTSLYSDLHVKYPKSLVVQQMPLLHWLQGQEFESAFIQYARPMFAKGVPSLFNSVKSLYRIEANIEAIEKLTKSEIESLEKKDSTAEPTTLLWVYYFLAQHYCRRSEFALALETIEKAITHSPTVMDVYLVKAKILSKAGDPVAAAENVEKARTMDLADRNLNTLSVKYWLRACNPTKAAANLAIFTKLDNSHYSNIFTMQVMWYERLLGQAQLRRDDLAKALKAFNNTIDHFHEIDEDQYDFFHYGVRYFTMATFVRLMRMEDRLHGQEKYISAAKGMVKAYLRLDDSLKASGASGNAASSSTSKTPFSPSSFAYHDYFQLDESLLTVDSNTEADGAAGGKKKAPPPKKKTADDSAAPAAPVKPWNGKHDRDPNGEMLKSTKVPLRQAAPFVDQLMANAFDDLEAHIIVIPYYLRTNHFALALRSVQQAIEIGTAKHPRVHMAIIDFAHSWASSSSKTSSTKLNDIIETNFKRILGSVSALEYNTAFSKTAQTFAARFAAAASFVLLGKMDESVESLVLNVGKDKAYCVESLIQARYLVFSTWKQSYTKFKSAVAESYPLVAHFAAPKPQPEEQTFEVPKGE